MASIPEWITAVVAVLALFGAGWQIHQVNKQRQRDFEDLFVQRYWTIMDRLSPEAIESRPTDPVVSRTDRAAVVAYLRLCEDEIELRAEGWVRLDTWKLWRAGIAAQLCRWPFDAVWCEVSKHESEKGVTGQFARLRQLGDDLFSEGLDPRTTVPRLRRLGRGR